MLNGFLSTNIVCIIYILKSSCMARITEYFLDPLYRFLGFKWTFLFGLLLSEHILLGLSFLGFSKMQIIILYSCKQTWTSSFLLLHLSRHHDEVFCGFSISMLTSDGCLTLIIASDTQTGMTCCFMKMLCIASHCIITYN